MNTPYANMKREMESDRKKRNKRWKSYAKHVKSPVRKLARYLGTKGIVGGTVGFLLTGGPIGLVSGAIIGKNSKEIYSGAIKIGDDIWSAELRAREYSTIDNSLDYKPTKFNSNDLKYNPQEDASKLEKTICATRRAWKHTTNAIGNGLNKIDSVALRSGRQIKLETVAAEVSSKIGRYVSPKEIYGYVQNR